MLVLHLDCMQAAVRFLKINEWPQKAEQDLIGENILNESDLIDYFSRD